ncbi:MAG: hypothetical protein NTW87_07605 [Planctomycetota bacterium]|nr:hypothetical protein [Planctomycetota bacterium]
MTLPLQFPLLALACLAAGAFAAEPPAPTWPLWDGQETVEQYARRVSLPTTKTLDQGVGNRLIEPGPEAGRADGRVKCRERLEGLLRYCYREAG